MNRHKNKILVLVDLKEKSTETIKYAIHVSNEINGALEIFYVKKPSEFITTENPLSAMRDISNECLKTEKELNNLVQGIIKDNFITIKNTFGFGNVKNEIENYIQKTRPDFIVIGNKRKKLLNFSDDNITAFLSKNYGKKLVVTYKTKISDLFEILNNKFTTGETA